MESTTACPDGPGRLVPPLRSDLRTEETEQAGEKVHFLVDSRFGRRIRLDRRGRDVVVLLDRAQPFQTLLDRIALTGTPMTPEALRRVLDAFAGLGLLEGSASDRDSFFMAHPRTPSSRPMAHPPTPTDLGMAPDGNADPVPLLIPEDLRFTCTGCGSCCLGVNVGPVGEAVARGVRDRMADLHPETASRKAPFFTMVPDGEDDEILVCQSRNGACLFLDPDGLCRIHRHLGAPAKPLVCRLFPYRFVWTPDGVLVGLQTECRDILRASLGRPVREQEAELREVLSLVPKIPKVRPHLSLDGETTCSYSDYLVLEREILAAVDAAAGRGGWAMLLAANRVLLARCRPAGDTCPDASDLRVEFYSLLRDVGETLVRLKDRYYEEGGHIRFHTGNLDMAVEALRDAPLFARMILSDEDGESSRFAHLVVSNFWRSREEAFGPPDLVTAASELAFAWFMTRALAVSRVRQVHRLAPDPRDLVDAWVSAHMLLRNHRVRDCLQAFRDRLRRVFVHRLGHAIEGRADLEQTNPQTDFYLF